MYQPEDLQATDEHPDAELAAAMDRSIAALGAAGLTVQDLLDALPEVRARVLEEEYGSAYMREIERKIAAYKAATDNAPKPIG